MTQDITIETVRTTIHRLPGRPPFMLAADLATIYEVGAKRIGEAVRRNPARFPEDFAFRLTRQEAETLRSQNATFQDFNHLPLAFTRAGANALAGVLKSKAAAERSVTIHRAFSALEEAGQKLGRIGAAPPEELLPLLRMLGWEPPSAAPALPAPAPVLAELLRPDLAELLRPDLAAVLRYRRLGLTQQEMGRLLDLSVHQVNRRCMALRHAGLLSTGA